MEEVKIKQVKLKFGTNANLNRSKKVLAKGEIVINTTYHTFRVGDGSTAIKDLKEPDNTTTTGDYILTMDLATNVEVISAKSGPYWQIVDDGKDPDTQLPGVLGYQ